MKKSTLMSFLAVIGLMACAEPNNEITLSGELGDPKPTYIHAFDTSDLIGQGKVQDDGSVVFNVDTKEPTIANIGYSEDGRKPLCMVIIDNQPTEVCIEDGKPVLKTGSQQNQRFFEAQDKVNTALVAQTAIMQEYHELQQKYQGQIPADEMAELEKRFDTASNNMDATLKEIIQINKDNIIPVLYLAQGADQLGTDFVKKFLKGYKYKDADALKPVFAAIRGDQNKVPGAPVVDFVGQNLDGKECHLTDYVGTGRYVLVDFWASWCGPCRAEMPNVKACYEEYHDKGFDIVGISFDNEKNAWAKAVADLDLPWIHLSDLRGWQCAASDTYNIKSIPATILYSPRGKVLKTNLRGDDLKNALKEYLDK